MGQKITQRREQLPQPELGRPGLQPGSWSAREYSPFFVCLSYRPDLQIPDGLQGGLGCCPKPANNVSLTGGQPTATMSGKPLKAEMRPATSQGVGSRGH